MNKTLLNKYKHCNSLEAFTQTISSQIFSVHAVHSVDDSNLFYDSRYFVKNLDSIAQTQNTLNRTYPSHIMLHVSFMLHFIGP